MTSRKERHQEFSNVPTGLYSSLYSELLLCSHSLLRQSLDERQRPVLRTVNNHYSSYAVGAIVLLVDGLEAWLNQSIWYLSRKNSDDPLFKLSDTSIMSKYRGVPKRACGSEMPDNRSLQMVVDLRNEIA